MSLQGDISYGPIYLPLKVDEKPSEFKLHYFEIKGSRWAVAYKGDIADGERVPLRIESACLFAHVFNSDKCDCGYQLNEALKYIARHKRGIVIYGIDQDARGLGIATHFRIYQLRQQEGLDSEELYDRLQMPMDARDYEPVITILEQLKVKKILLLSNNRERRKFLIDNGFDVKYESLEAPLNMNNMATLMLEKEDLDYDFSFKTHGDWLTPLQQKVEDQPDYQAIKLVQNNTTVIEEYVDVRQQWNLAVHMHKKYRGGLDGTIVYLTDLPRVDEIALYSEMGVPMVVVPFAVIPGWLQDAGEKYNIKIQDWGRKNKYSQPRPQWELVTQFVEIDIYKRDNKVRCVFLQDQSKKRFAYYLGKLDPKKITHSFQDSEFPWFEMNLHDYNDLEEGFFSEK